MLTCVSKLSHLCSATSATLYLFYHESLGRILIQFFLLRHVGHVLLQSAEASHPGPSFFLAGAHQVQALPVSLEDHREALVLLHRPGDAPQGLGLAALADTLHLRHCDWEKSLKKMKLFSKMLRKVKKQT